MAAIITDQIRILNAKSFVAGINTSSNSFYTWIGLTNPTDYKSNWNSSPPSPRDSFDQENDYWDTMTSMKKITSEDVMQVIPKRVWSSGTKYDMYRHDYTIDNLAPVSGSPTLYGAFYYVMNSDYRVYICLFNNSNPENGYQGSPSLDEPTFTDLEPRAAGSSGDGYIWKYLYTIKPSQAIKFDSTSYIPVPNAWETNTDDAPVRQNASTSGQLKIVTVKSRGVGLGTARTYTRVPIEGDGRGAEVTVVVNNDSKVESVTISKGGSDYTYGTVNLTGRVPKGTTSPTFDVIIPPSGGHGADIYRELGAYNVLTYSRFENDTENPDFITGNEFARIGLIENPLDNDSNTILSKDKASAVYALKLTSAGNQYQTATFTPDVAIEQTVGVGSTAIGRVISYDQVTGVLKYWQDRTNAGFNSDGTRNSSPIYGFETLEFMGNPATGGSLDIRGGSQTLGIDTNFGSISSPGISTVINSRTYFLGQSFVQGVAQPESKKYSGNIIHVDNRPSVTRSSSQKEDVKIILQF